jgi:hypothetical protein
MRSVVATVALAGMIVLTGCGTDEDSDQLETVPEAPTHAPVEHDPTQFEDDPLSPDTAAPESTRPEDDGRLEDERAEL